jgi:hypothetical protein
MAREGAMQSRQSPRVLEEASEDGEGRRSWPRVYSDPRRIKAEKVPFSVTGKHESKFHGKLHNQEK